MAHHGTDTHTFGGARGRTRGKSSAGGSKIEKWTKSDSNKENAETNIE